MYNKPSILWQQYVEWFISHITARDMGTKGEGLLYLRNRLFVSILLIAFPICAIVYIPSVIVSFTTGMFMIGFFDTAAMAVFCYLFLSRNASMLKRKMIFSVTFYILSFILLYYLGLKGPAMFIFLCNSVLISLYQSKKAGLISVMVNAVIFLVYLAFLPDAAGKFSFFGIYEVVGWFAVCANLIAFNAIVVLSSTSLVDQLNESLLQEFTLQSQLTREREELIIAKNKAEESDRLKSAFLANISHEIRTPMNGILGFADLLNSPDLSEEDQNQYLYIIRKSGQRMLILLKNIIDISKIESDCVDLYLKETNINEQIDYICDLFKPDAQIKNLTFRSLSRFPDEQMIIITDEQKFITILTNLVRNAIKYTKSGGVEIGYDLISSDSDEKMPFEKHLRFYVKDTGIGIPLNRQKDIFERFIQADIEDKLAMEGAGLGLSIAEAYVQMLGGKIWVESEPEVGSTFYFTIPYKL